MFKSKGQATIEYLLVLVFVMLIGTRFAKGVSNFIAQSTGNFAVVLSHHLSVGVCKEDCWFLGFANGKDPQ